MKHLDCLMVLCLLSACGASGTTGQSGAVRFSPVLAFKDTRGLSPIAAGRAVQLRLGPPEVSTTPPGALTLLIEGGEHTVAPLGNNDFAVEFRAAGSFVLRAMDGAREVDRLAVTAARVEGLRLSSTGSVVTRLKRSSGDCTRTDVVDVAGFALHTNQTLRLDAVPLDRSGSPLTGELSLSASASNASVRLETPPIYDTLYPNTVVVTPQALGAPVTLTVEERSTLSVTLELPTRDAEATGVCN